MSEGLRGTASFIGLDYSSTHTLLTWISAGDVWGAIVHLVLLVPVTLFCRRICSVFCVVSIFPAYQLLCVGWSCVSPFIVAFNDPLPNSAVCSFLPAVRILHYPRNMCPV